MTWKEIFQKAEDGFVVEQGAESQNALDVKKEYLDALRPEAAP